MAKIRVGIKDGSLEKRKFIFTINTENAGSASDTFVLPFRNLGLTYNVTIEWGDGTTSTITSYNDPDLTHVYSTPGIYTVKVLGVVPQIYFNNAGDKLKVMSINQWGDIGMVRGDGSFMGCSNMECYATDSAGKMSSVTNMSNMFRGCTSFNPPSLSFDCSNVTNMFYMFLGCSSLNCEINFNTSSNVTNFGYMFQSCNSLNSTVTLNCQSTTSLQSLFYSCSSLNTHPNLLNTGGVTNMSSLFFQCSSLNIPITLQTDSLQVTNNMFGGCSNFNSPVNLSNTTNLTNITSMFHQCGKFNQPIEWDVPNLSNATRFLYFCGQFNSPITFNNSNSLSNLSYFMYGSQNFNQPITFSNTSNVTNLNASFGYTKIDQNLGYFDLSSCTNISNIFSGNNNISQTNYDNILIGWTGWDNGVSTKTVNSGLNLSVGSTKYTLGGDAEAARSYLLTSKSWTITDGGGI